MTKKKEPVLVNTEEGNGNGNGHHEDFGELVSAIKGMAQGQESLHDRLDELEERIRAEGNEAKLRLVNLLYDTSDERVIELAKISPLAVRSFAAALTLERIGDPDVVAGKASISKIYLLNLLRVGRSSKAWYFMSGMPALQEQLTTEADKKSGLELEMGAGER